MKFSTSQQRNDFLMSKINLLKKPVMIVLGGLRATGGMWVRDYCQEHGEVVQPVLNYGTHAAESTDPSGVEPMSVGAFDAEQ